MFPVLFRIFEFSIRSYGFFVALGVIISYNYIKILSKKKNLDFIFLNNIFFNTLIFGFLGARIFYVLLNLDYYKENFLDIFKIWEGGLVFYGGFFSGLIFGILYTIHHKKNLLEVMDFFTPPLYLGLSIGRIGCFLAGCCWGKEVPSYLYFLGVIFSDPESMAPLGIKLFPTQIFEFLYALLIFAIAHFMMIKNLFRGKIFFISSILYSIFRFLNEFLRGDERGNILVFSTSQFISLILFLLSLFFIFHINKWKKKYLK